MVVVVGGIKLVEIYVNEKSFSIADMLLVVNAIF